MNRNPDKSRRSRVNRILLAPIALGLLLLGGCASDNAPPRAKSGKVSDAITQLHLITFPTGINMDAIPGQDGIALKVFAGNTSRPKPLPVRAGELEILLFDGLLKSSSGGESKPLKVWRFSTDELKAHEFTSTIGVGYQLTLVWADAKPTKGRATVMARLVLSEERAVYSAPSPITLGG